MHIGSCVHDFALLFLQRLKAWHGACLEACFKGVINDQMAICKRQVIADHLTHHEAWGTAHGCHLYICHRHSFMAQMVLEEGMKTSHTHISWCSINAATHTLLSYHVWWSLQQQQLRIKWTTKSMQTDQTSCVEHMSHHMVSSQMCGSPLAESMARIWQCLVRDIGVNNCSSCICRQWTCQWVNQSIDFKVCSGSSTDPSDYVSFSAVALKPTCNVQCACVLRAARTVMKALKGTVCCKRPASPSTPC